MTLNPYIETAVTAFEEIGENFHNVMLWHVAHGIVLISPEFLTIGYYCGNDDTDHPLPVGDANTFFVTFTAGSVAALKRVTPENVRFVAFERGLKN